MKIVYIDGMLVGHAERSTLVLERIDGERGRWRPARRLLEGFIPTIEGERVLDAKGFPPRSAFEIDAARIETVEFSL